MKPHHRTIRILATLVMLLGTLAFVATSQATSQEASPVASPQATPMGTPADARRPDPSAVQVPEGFQLEVYATGFNYLADITFDDEGTAYVVETGDHTYGTTPETAPSPRVLRLLEDGSTEVVYDEAVPLEEIRAADSSADMPEGLIGPVTGVTWHDGLLYIAHRTRVSTLDPESGEFTTIINGMPSWGFFHNNKVIFGPDGKMYFFLSTQGNAGPIDEHWMKVINIYNKPNAHEVACEDVTLTGTDFGVPVENPDTPDVDDKELTGVYVPLGTETEAGQVIEGEVPCNGAMLRANPDGSELEVVAWGLRSDYGYRFSAEGRLVATQNSGNPIEPRAIHEDWETVYEIEEGAWYGWPDFYSSIPITDSHFSAPGEPRSFVLTEETHRKLLDGADAPPQPLARLEAHSAAEGLVFGREEFGMDPENEVLVAEFGTIVVSHATEGVLPGFRVQKVDLETGTVSDFLVNTSGQPASVAGDGGLERPIQLEWGPDGALYIVDFGVINVTETGMMAEPGSGVIWRLVPDGDSDAATATPDA